MTMKIIADLIIAGGVIWAIAGFLQYLHVVKMNNTLHKLGGYAERVFWGRDKKLFKTRLYLLAATNLEGKVVNAVFVYPSRFLKPSKEVPAQELNGMHILNIPEDIYESQESRFRAVAALKKDYTARKDLVTA